MPFINDTEKRNVLQQAVPAEFVRTPGFGETFAASLGNVIDEDLSISRYLNREGWETRQKLITQKIADGALDREKYIDRTGRFDYNRAAIDLNDPLIKTDEVLEQERAEVLAQRRAYGKDVIERGNGMAQFLGMANAYMLDPISIATMPIALPATGAKSLSIAGRSLLAARNAAAINTATELAIQPLVYEHKQDIDSPYTYQDALQNIAFAAGGSAVIGGVAGGVSGYLRKVIGETENKGLLDDESVSALENLERLAEAVEYGRANRPNYDVAMNDYDKLIQGEYDSFFDASRNTIKELESEIKDIEKGSETLADFIKKAGGMDREIAKAEGFDSELFKAQGSKPLFRKTGGKSPDEIAELLNEANFRGGNLTANDVVDLIDSVSRGERLYMDADAAARIDFNQRQIDDLSSNTEEEFLESVYKGARENDIQADIDYLEELELQRQASAGPSVVPEQYRAAPEQAAPKATVSSREDFILESEGIRADFDRDIQKFNELESPKIIADGDIMDASKVMSDLDKELEGIDSVLVCAYG